MGLALFGIFKKVVVADRLALYVDAVYSNPSAHSGSTLLLATYAFAFQIYADFSGYSDVAIGCARALGFDLRPNFDRPYASRSIREFWRRWHISLSFWLRDYLYVPLGGSQHGRAKTIRNLFVTMILGGLWHGAAWTFVVWGALQGALLAVSHVVRRPEVDSPLRRAFDVLVTFHLVCLGWVFFRAANLSDAMAVLSGLTRDGATFVDAHTIAHGTVGVVVMLLVESARSFPDRVRFTPNEFVSIRAVIVSAALLLGVALLGVEEGSQFIYLQF
jgi:D-alanyl-lipoteichoic acid acyltransferase DltB (MBOAT superfamily)